MRWLFLRNNADTYTSRRGTSEVKPRPIFDTMLDFTEETTAEGLLAETYRRVTETFPTSQGGESRENTTQFLEEVKERKKLRKWKEGRTYREPVVTSLEAREQQVLTSYIADPLCNCQSVRVSAEKRLESIFEPGLWSQLQAIKQANLQGKSNTAGLFPVLQTRKSGLKEETKRNEGEIIGNARRKQYGRWYIRPKDWEKQFRKEIGRVNVSAK